MTETVHQKLAVPVAAPAASPWPIVYKRVLALVDLVAIVAAVSAAATVAGLSWVWPPDALTPWYSSVYAVGAGTAIAQLAVLAGNGSRSPRVAGTGATEYRRIILGTIMAYALIALIAYVLSIPSLHVFLAVGLTGSLAALLLARWLARKWLVAQRRAGGMTRFVLLAGSPASVASVAYDLERNPAAGFKVVGACTPSGLVAGTIPGTEIPVSGTIGNLPQALAATGADTVIITSANEFSSAQVRELSWSLEPGHQHLVVAPSLTDIGGPRLHIRPVNGLPLVHVETPRYEGGKLYLKRFFDVAASGVLILLLSPVLIAIAMMIRLSTPGTVLFRQDRIGLKGNHFQMLKFRSMYEDAEARLTELADLERDEGNSVMFKMRDDPRVTPIGKILRRYSLDELPQLFNVFFGSMSLVGPRPPLDREVVQYHDHVHRRFLVKPGITGLWQVSGRSNLDWDETVRLDLFYVENWTLVGDLFILGKTVKAVLMSDGAY